MRGVDTGVFKEMARVWINDAIDKNGGIDIIREQFRTLPSTIETFLVGWAQGAWNHADHPQKFSVEETRRMHDLVHLIFETGSTTS